MPGSRKIRAEPIENLAVNMRTATRVIFLLLAVLGCACQLKPVPGPFEIARSDQIGPAPSARPPGLPFNQYAARNAYHTDYQNFDLSDRDLRSSLPELLGVDFNSRTRWPEAAYLPSGFDPQAVLALGCNPGLGVREIHQEGITGEDVGIALIDSPLNPRHREYERNLVLYESIGAGTGSESRMHGTAVASLAAGKTVGTAPGANLYFFAASNNRRNDDGSITFDYTNPAGAVRRILEINRNLPKRRKIRVISMSMAIRPEWADTSLVMRAIDQARAEGIFVLYSNLEDAYGFGFHGLGRNPLDDPDDPASYVPAITRIEDYDGAFDEGMLRLLVPMDSRAFADHADPQGYIFDRVGGRSWAVPYIAGIYALAVQVDPDVTGERFWSAALETSQSIDLRTGQDMIVLAPVLDPAALIDALRKTIE
jgi:hypothetical protein